jgi:hypothetical protein
VLYFYRPHPTLVVDGNFCGCIFFDPCSEKNKKNSKNIKKFDSTSAFWKNKGEKLKSLIPTSAFWKNQEKIQEKGKFRVICFLCVFFPSSFVFTLLRYVSTRLSQQL